MPERLPSSAVLLSEILLLVLQVKLDLVDAGRERDVLLLPLLLCSEPAGAAELHTDTAACRTEHTQRREQPHTWAQAQK